MANVCILRHQGHIKSKMHFPYRHNFRTLKNYGNKNVDSSLTHLNTCIVNDLKNGETYLTAFNRMYESGEFKGQLKVQGAVDKRIYFMLNKMNKNSSAHISATKNPLKIKGFRKRETGFKQGNIVI
ncbi:MAG TPA: hypothetical protein GXX75_07150 [Clostridiales bacterium]|nr:hypothetical protein [Clostridiales bacterium]